MNFGRNAKYPYLVSAVGVALVAITAVYGAVRAMMIRETFRRGSNGPRQFGNSFGLTNSLTLLAIIIAIAGLVWLGFVLRNSQKTAT